MKTEHSMARSLATPLADVGESFLRHQHHLAPRTKDDYRDAFIRLSGFLGGRATLADLTSDNVNRYLAHKAHRPYTARLDAIGLKRLSRWAAEENILAKDPLAGVRTPKTPKRRREELRDEMVRPLIEAAGESRFPIRDKAIIVLALVTALRPNELRQLTLADLDLRDGFIRVREETSKTPEGERVIPLDPQAIAILDSYVNDFRITTRAETLFVNQRGTTFTENGWCSLFARIRDRLRDRDLAGFTAYRMRHTAITNWKRIGLSAPIVQQLAGHKSIQTTQLYFGKMSARELRRLPSAFSQVYGRAVS